MRRIALLCLALPLLLSSPALADNWAVFPPGSPWNGVLAGAWPYVSQAHVAQCDGAGCVQIATATGYQVMATWSTPAGPVTLPTAVTANHVLCVPGAAPAQQIQLLGRTLAVPSGLCGNPYVYAPPGADTAAWPVGGVSGGLPLAPLAWPSPGDQLLVTGYPMGSPAADLVTVQASDVPGSELEPDGTSLPLPGVIIVTGPIYEGNSGSPALDSQGRVVGTVVAGGGQSGWTPDGRATWDGIHALIVPWWEGY